MLSVCLVYSDGNLALDSDGCPVIYKVPSVIVAFLKHLHRNFAINSLTRRCCYSGLQTRSELRHKYRMTPHLQQLHTVVFRRDISPLQLTERNPQLSAKLIANYTSNSMRTLQTQSLPLRFTTFNKSQTLWTEMWILWILWILWGVASSLVITGSHFTSYRAFLVVSGLYGDSLGTRNTCLFDWSQLLCRTLHI